MRSGLRLNLDGPRKAFTTVARPLSRYCCKQEDWFTSEVSSRLVDRLSDCTREFPTIAVLAGAGESVLRRLPGSRANPKDIIYIEPSDEMRERARRAMER